MDWLLTIICSVLIVELVLRLPFAKSLTTLLSCIHKVVPVLKVAASDHWKEKAMCAYARRTFLASGALAALLALALGAAALLVLIIGHFLQGFESFFLSWYGLGACAAAATLYVLLRNAVIRA